MKNYWHFLLLLLLLQFSYAEKSNESWNGINIEVKLPYSMKLGIEQNLRFVDQSPKFKQTFTEISLSYKLFKDVLIILPFRYAIFDDKTKQRLSFASSYKYSINPFSMKYRLKFQRVFEDGNFSNDMIRNKLWIRYKFNKRFRPFIAGEILQIEKSNKYQLDEYRFSLGFKIDFFKNRSINIFYTLKKEDINKLIPDQINVFGLGYNYTI